MTTMSAFLDCFWSFESLPVTSLKNLGGIKHKWVHNAVID